ncbi:MAG TPA: STAS domain-containing protein [bacterium]|nr:STAS domain-containing protein [bacterium]HQL61841.1 STAS domain-containing protein [bacterium]
MIECTTTKESGLARLNIKGRIDTNTAPQVQKELDDLIAAGEQKIVLNLEEVHYVSSAALRVFLVTQKQLKRSGGEVILCGAAPSVMEVFKLSGFDQIFRVVKGEEGM